MRLYLLALLVSAPALLEPSEAAPGGASSPGSELTNSAWVTNAPAVFARIQLTSTDGYLRNTQNLSLLEYQTATRFDHYLPASLNHLIWTNFIAHTNGRDMSIWSVRSHPTNWPQSGPVVAWNTNSLAWGMRGLTALSPCWEDEGSSGQAPVTALTRRHGYARGHSMGADGVNSNRTGHKVWFVTTNDVLIEVRVQRALVRTVKPDSRRDYTILLFDKDLPDSISPLRVANPTNFLSWYPAPTGAPRPIFKSEQSGRISAEVPGFWVDTWKGGDSGSPDLLPMPGELLFIGGRSTSGPSPEMQTDMNILCRIEGLDPGKYQMQWVDLSRFPSY